MKKKKKKKKKKKRGHDARADAMQLSQHATSCSFVYQHCPNLHNNHYSFIVMRPGGGEDVQAFQQATARRS
jgi:hypothetical protein